MRGFGATFAAPKEALGKHAYLLCNKWRSANPLISKPLRRIRHVRMADDLAEPHMPVPEIKAPCPPSACALMSVAERPDAKARDVDRWPDGRIALHRGCSAGQPLARLIFCLLRGGGAWIIPSTSAMRGECICWEAALCFFSGFGIFISRSAAGTGDFFSPVNRHVVRLGDKLCQQKQMLKHLGATRV